MNTNNYTLLGNPFASPIDFQSLTKSNVKNAFYVWDPKLSGSQGVGGFVTFIWNSGSSTYDATSAISPVSKYIQSGEAVFIESNDKINPGTITVKESDKSASGADQIYGRPSMLYQQLRVNLYAMNADATRLLLDGVLTTYSDDNSNAVDNEDAKKINGGSENIGLKRDSIMLSIERRKTIETNDTTFLNLYQMKSQSYQLGIITQNLNTLNATAVIKDSYSGTINNMPLDMNGTTNITFDVNPDPASYAINRFSIVFIPNVVLPVTFKKVDVYLQHKYIGVEWTTENEINIKKYEVEKSANGRDFVKINTTAPTAVNGGGASYKFPDNDLFAGINYYRIRSIDQNGNSRYSIAVKVNVLAVKVAPSLVVYPNPVTGNTFTLQLENFESGNYSMQLFTMAGALVSEKTIKVNGNGFMESFEINAKFSAGKYELKLTGNHINFNTTVIKR